MSDDAAATDKPISHGLGVGSGSIIEHPDGTVEYRQTGKLLSAVKVRPEDIRGFTIRKATRDDKKRLNAKALQQVLTIQGLGTTLAEVAVNYQTAEKIENWFRAHPRFGSTVAPNPAPATGGSVADELEKLAGLLDRDIITETEFAEQKRRLLQ